MPRARKQQNAFNDWELVNVRPEFQIIEHVKVLRAKNKLTFEQLFYEILAKNVKISFSQDDENDCVIVSVTPKGSKWEDLRTTFVFRSTTIEVLFWIILYYAVEDAWGALAKRPNTEYWNL